MAKRTVTDGLTIKGPDLPCYADAKESLTAFSLRVSNGQTETCPRAKSAPPSALLATCQWHNPGPQFFCARFLRGSMTQPLALLKSVKEKFSRRTQFSRVTDQVLGCPTQNGPVRRDLGTCSQVTADSMPSAVTQSSIVSGFNAETRRFNRTARFGRAIGATARTTPPRDIPAHFNALGQQRWSGRESPRILAGARPSSELPQLQCICFLQLEVFN
jgi:hypothetical protein